MKKLVAVVVAVLAPVVSLVGPAGADDAAPTRPSRVALTSNPVVGAAVKAVPATWTRAPDRRTYEWLLDGEGAVIGRESSYSPLPADAGHTLVVIERTWFGSTVDETSSVPVPVTVGQAVVAPAPTATSAVPVVPAAGAPTVNTRRPTISGTGEVGKKLSARSRGVWTPAPASFTYQWLRSGKKISGATKSSYRLTSKDRRKKMSVRISAARAGVPAVTATSSASKRVR